MAGSAGPNTAHCRWSSKTPAMPETIFGIHFRQSVNGLRNTRKNAFNSFTLIKEAPCRVKLEVVEQFPRGIRFPRPAAGKNPQQIQPPVRHVHAIFRCARKRRRLTPHPPCPS